MHINRLCFVLPADADEIQPKFEANTPAKKPIKKHSERSCGGQVLGFIGDSLRRVYEANWVSFCYSDVQKKQHSGVFHDLEGVQISEKVGGDNPRIFSYAELYIGSNGFNEDEVLGSGGFGVVYRAVLPSDGTVVAVKCLAEKGERFEKTFAAELVAVAHLRHRNLVRLRGWCVHEDQLLLVYDYMPNRSLDRFNLAETTRIGGTIGYLPPECFQKRSVATAKSDVFSFGIVVLEVVSGRRAVDLTYSDDQIVLLDWIRRLSDEGKLLQAGDNRLKDGSYKLSEMDGLIHLGLLCTLHNPQLRPNMKWVVEALSGNSNIANLPALPSFQSHPLYISLSSPTNTTITNTTTTASINSTGSNTTVTSTSSNYITALGETIYATAEFESSDSKPYDNRSQRRTAFFMVETPREISFKEIISATNNFSDSQRVAELDFGTAYHGILENQHHVLVKRLGMNKCPALRARFSDELQNLGRLRHRNLVQLRGWCTEQGEMLVVYDYSANRLLSHLLFHHNHVVGNSVLRWHQRYNIVKSLASAILYLHEEWDEQVIHKNITSSAIILDPDMNPRLSSFALAEFLTRNDHGHHQATKGNKSVRGIFGYISPEYIESGEATTMADVYSFGVLMLEVVSGQMAVDFRRPEVLVVKRVREFEAQKRPLEELADLRLNGEYNHKELMRLTKLGIVCTLSKPELRPSMRQIVSILDGNDKCFMEEEKMKESMEEWKQSNASSFSLIKRIQALGIQ
ncbi:hypothetical protein Patl1_25988 [Pistacia atlantica]|uniref:Uncharacterized protein n=1 Tax=Pistacia atlantica TaxID=434234 RepID=A0ACC1B2L4_9ROSI|nr:hypothetical protein Patl1_25988 [Pistacia atlantica]